MSLYDTLIRPALFRLDPEKAHDLACWGIRRGFLSEDTVVDPIELAGVKFLNKVGLAAGFDKSASLVNHLHRAGFGFAEIGTVTRHAQPGNDRPRLFRFPDQKALINRMGFNNPGAEEVAKRLAKSKPQLPLGINIGKSKVTENEDAASDYGFSLERLKDYGDYFVVNVSSPNTPGLRGLQEKSSLNRILWRLKEIEGRKPMFVKIAPDLGEEALQDVVDVVRDLGLTGIVATNTTISRAGLPGDNLPQGGMSGAPLTHHSDTILSTLRQMEPSLILIGSGGVMSPQDAVRKLGLGASVVQVYTGWVYGGPGWVSTLAKACAEYKPKLIGVG